MNISGQEIFKIYSESMLRQKEKPMQKKGLFGKILKFFVIL